MSRLAKKMSASRHVVDDKGCVHSYTRFLLNCNINTALPVVLLLALQNRCSFIAF